MKEKKRSSILVLIGIHFLSILLLGIGSIIIFICNKNSMNYLNISNTLLLIALLFVIIYTGEKTSKYILLLINMITIIFLWLLLDKYLFKVSILSIINIKISTLISGYILYFIIKYIANKINPIMEVDNFINNLTNVKNNEEKYYRLDGPFSNEQLKEKIEDIYNYYLKKIEECKLKKNSKTHKNYRFNIKFKLKILNEEKECGKIKIFELKETEFIAYASTQIDYFTDSYYGEVGDRCTGESKYLIKMNNKEYYIPY